MIEPKPLSPEDRYLFDIMARDGEGTTMITGREIHALLAAEQFWREVVKKAKPFAESDEYVMYCAFCEKPDYGTVKHKLDCPWLLAQG